MAGYGLRYYKEYGLQDSIVKLQIYKKYQNTTYAPPPIEIGGVLTSAKLILQGDQDDVTAPIVKTSLELSLVDDPGSEYGRMTGPWEEFYTPDSTEFIVHLSIDGVREWSGYITPDSYEEDILKYGVVTLVARDNIGHLQDFIFEEKGNEDGMISVLDIIDRAWMKIESPSRLMLAEGATWPECYGYRPYECMVNVEAFSGKNWYEVLESVLDSFGMALRYVGKATYKLFPLRDLPLLDHSSYADVEVHPTLFKAAGHRSLQRACKKIVDVLKYETGSIYAMDLQSSDFERTAVAMNAATWQPSESAKWQRFGNIGTINPYEFAKDPKGGASFSNAKSLFASVVAVPDTDNYLVLNLPLMASDLMADILFNFDGRFFSAEYDGQYVNVGTAKKQTVTLFYSIECDICNDSCEHNWFDFTTNEFVTVQRNTEVVLEYGETNSKGAYGAQSATVNHSVRIPAGTTNLQLKIFGFTASVRESGAFMRPSNRPIQDLIDAGKAYCRISDIVVSQSDAADYTEYRTVTLYDEAYNNLITRDPALGAGPVVLSAKVIRNGIYLPETSYPPATPWNWPNDDLKTELQALIAQQILLYNSKPNNLLTGTLVSDDLLRLPGIWSYEGKNHILISGSLDLLTGYLEDVKLREYVEWGDLYPEQHNLLTEEGDNLVTDSDDKIIIGIKE